MNFKGECQAEAATIALRKDLEEVKAQAEFKLYGELETSETILTYEYDTANPTVWQPLQELIQGPDRGVKLDTPLSPFPSTFTVVATGVYNFTVDLSFTNPNSGGVRVMELSTFVNGAIQGKILQFEVTNFDIGSVTFTGLSQLISEDAVVDIRLRKISGGDLTLNVNRTNITVWGSFNRSAFDPIELITLGL